MQYTVTLEEDNVDIPSFWDAEIIEASHELRAKLHDLGYVDHVPSVDEVDRLLNPRETGVEPVVAADITYSDVDVKERHDVKTVSADKVYTWTLKNGDTVRGECWFSGDVELGDSMQTNEAVAALGSYKGDDAE